MWSPARLLLGSGRFPDALRAELEAEGIELIEEGIGGSLRYTDFKAPGRRFDGKVQPHRMALAITRKRFVVYCRSGGAELIDSPWTSPNFEWLDVEVREGGRRLVLTVDYDRANRDDVAGQVAIHLKTSSAGAIASQIEARAPRR